MILHEWIAFYSAVLNIHRSGVLTALAWLVPQESAARESKSRRVLCTPYNHAPCHFMQSHIRKVYACLAVTCHLHFWQNDRGLLRATVRLKVLYRKLYNDTEPNQMLIMHYISHSIPPPPSPPPHPHRHRRTQTPTQSPTPPKEEFRLYSNDCGFICASTNFVGGYKWHALFHLSCLQQTFYCLSTNKKLLVSWQFSGPYGVTK